LESNLNQYRELAEHVGGKAGEKFRELIEDYERMKKSIYESEVPDLLGSKQVAELLNIDPKNMHHKQKTKFFPKPTAYIGKRPLWLEQSIKDYIERVDQWREKEKED